MSQPIFDPSSLSTINSPEELELFGKTLNKAQFLELLNVLISFPDFQGKLPFLLVGLQTQIFSHSLNNLQSQHLALFKDEGLLEPLQYHLTQIVHEGESLVQTINQQIEEFEGQLNATNVQELTIERLKGLILPIDTMRNQLLDFLERLSTALSMAWNTGRPDLVEKLSDTHERLLHELTLRIGHPSSKTLSPSGLYQKIQESFSKVYDLSLKDEDASIEGLTRLAIWHLRDYWELGLLPDIHTQHELDSGSQDETVREEYHQKLFSEVQAHLEKLNLGTVKDLKKNLIFSKPLLKTYIDKNRHLLK